MIQLSPRTTTFAVVAVLIAGTGSIAGAAWRNEEARPKNCVTHGGLIDMSTITVVESAPPDLNAGDTIGNQDVLSDPHGGRVGVGSGSIMLYTSPQDGSLREDMSEWGLIDGSTFYGHVTLSVANVAFGEPIDMPVVGVTGKDRGESGTYQLRLYWRINDHLSEFTGSLTTCAG